MALDTYANLKTSILDWMTRSDLSGNVAEWVTLAEARLNRELSAVETDSTLTGVADSRTIDVSSYSIDRPLWMMLIDSDTSDEIELTRQDKIVRRTTADDPRYWEYNKNSEEINFDVPLNEAYTFRLRYDQKFALSDDSATTNWLLTNHPDVYLAACIAWGSVFTEKMDAAAGFRALLETELVSVKQQIGETKRSPLVVDPMLQQINQRDYYFTGRI